MLLVINYYLISNQLKLLWSIIVLYILHVKLLLFESENFKMKVLNTFGDHQNTFHDNANSYCF